MSSQTVANVTNITTAQVLAAEAGASAGGVGTYAFAHKSAGGSASNFGNTIAGSSLDVAGVGGIGGTLSGTWRCMGYAQDPNSSFLGAMTVWQRIS